MPRAPKKNQTSPSPVLTPIDESQLAFTPITENSEASTSASSPASSVSWRSSKNTQKTGEQKVEEFGKLMELLVERDKIYRNTQAFKEIRPLEKKKHLLDSHNKEMRDRDIDDEEKVAILSKKMKKLEATLEKEDQDLLAINNIGQYCAKLVEISKAPPREKVAGRYCDKCHQRTVIKTTLQVRRGDEGENEKYQCQNPQCRNTIIK